MLLFRSEEHIERWCSARGIQPGAILSLEQGWGLAKSWYSDRLSQGYRRKSPGEAEAVFASVGLAGDFWSLT